MRVVEVRDVSVRVPGASVRRLDLTVRAGEIQLLVGDAGVVTVLRALAGALTPSAGAVRVDGDDVTTRPGAVLVPAGWLPYAGLTVAEHLLVAAHGAVDAASPLFGLLPDEKPAADLAGDERQLLAVLCALSRRPRVLLLEGPAGVATMTALRAARAATIVAASQVPDDTGQYDRVHVARGEGVRLWIPGSNAPLSTPGRAAG